MQAQHNQLLYIFCFSPVGIYCISVTLNIYEKLCYCILVKISISINFPFIISVGEHDASKIANIGSNQYDIKPTIFFHKTLGDFSIDAAVKYYFRLNSESTNVLPGEELHLQCLLGYNLTDKFKLGPSINWMISKDKEHNGILVNDSARETLSAGADFYYRFSRLSVTFTYLGDIYIENSTRGHFLQLKTVYHF